MAQRLMHLKDREPIVYSLVRGGVPVGFEIAKALGAPLDIVLVRKIGVPGNPEYAAGAIVDGEQHEIVLNEDVVAMLGIPMAAIQATADSELKEIERRRKLYLGGRQRQSAAGKTAIIVDDGIATGATIRAALRSIRRQKPAWLVLAVPTAPAETLEKLSAEADEIVCVDMPEYFPAIGLFYKNFNQVSDQEVIDLLARADRLASDAQRAETAPTEQADG